KNKLQCVWGGQIVTFEVENARAASDSTSERKAPTCYKLGSDGNALTSTPLADTLKKTSLFSALSRTELEALAKRTSIHSFEAGETLFSEGEPCSGFYVVASGRVRIFKTSASGREQVLAIEGPGGSVAELPVFDGGPYPASVAAVEPAELVFISRKDFQTFC